MMTVDGREIPKDVLAEGREAVEGFLGTTNDEDDTDPSEQDDTDNDPEEGS